MHAHLGEIIIQLAYWMGPKFQVLLKQDYYPDDEAALIADWVRHFQDRRYYTIDGRPLLVIYNPKLIPDAPRTIARWRRILEKNETQNRPTHLHGSDVRDAGSRVSFI